MEIDQLNEDASDMMNTEESAENNEEIDAYDLTPISPTDHVFQFELGPAVLHQLLVKLLEMPVEPFAKGLQAHRPGFYQMIYDGKAVYIGQTKRPVGERLGEHHGKLRYRIGIDLSKIECRYAYVVDRSLIDLSESELIRHFDAEGLAEWNTSGFGSKTTGYGRANQRLSKWAEKYPPDMNVPITAGSDRTLRLDQLVRQIGSLSPVTVSIPDRFKTDFLTAYPAEIVVLEETKPLKDWLDDISIRLSAPWRIERKTQGVYITYPI
jgi:hypothetical protein